MAVHDLVERPLVAVEGEDDRLVGGNSSTKRVSLHAVRVVLAREEAHQVNDVDYAHLELRRVLAQPLRRRHRLQGRDVAGAAEDDVGFFPSGRCKPTPR